MRIRRTVVGRSGVDRTIHARAPQLLKLPLAVPSVPILAPVVSPIVGGNNNNNNSPGTTAPANNPAPAQPTPAPGSSPPPSNGGSGSPPSGSTPSTGGDGSSPAVVPPVVDPGSGTGSGGVSGDTPASGGSGDSPASGSPVDSSTPGTSGDSPATGSGTLPSDGTSGSPTSGSVLEGGGGGTANAGSGYAGGGTNDPSGGVSNAAGVTTGSQGSQSKNSGGLSAGGSGSTVSGNDPNSPVSGVEKGHMSTGAIAAVVIICFAFFFILLIFFFRRRLRKRRNEQATTWWFSRKRTSQTYGDAETLVASSDSARSSFASTASIPRPPPMAEVGRVTASSLQAVIDPSRFKMDEIPDNRFSIGSNNSENSQFLFVNLRNSVQVTQEMAGQALSPMSQSFAFPKPPSPAGDRVSAYSRPDSKNGTLRTMRRRPDSDDSSLFSFLRAAPFPPTTVSFVGSDPFASDPFGDNDPFQDSQSIAAPATVNEIIRRPYQRALEDEVTVSVGEYVHVLMTFEDGWAYVVKVPPAGLGRDTEDVLGGNKGLIPIDCLREPGEDLPTFIAAKRLSNYGDGETFTVL